MPIVVADTGPINYLILIAHIQVLPVLFEKIILPSVVRDELTQPKTPPVARNWIADPPAWLDIRSAPPANDLFLAELEPAKKRRLHWQPPFTPTCSSWMTAAASKPPGA